MARALVNNDGSTDIEVTTGELDASATPPGNLAKVQNKGLSGSTLMFTRNHNGLNGGGYAKFTYTNVPRGLKVQVQANVRDIDPKRTDVVTVTTDAVRRPDLAASNLQAPAKAAPGAPVVITATVSEVNGDVGATGNCVLYVNGAEADRANGVWVDAGDAVACAFTQTFNSSGTRGLEVRVESVVPGDANSGNNSVTGSIDITDPATTFDQYWGYVWDQNWEQHYANHTTYSANDGSWGYDYGSLSRYDESHSQGVSFDAYKYGQIVTLPVRVEGSTSSNGNTSIPTVTDIATWDWTSTWNDPNYGYTQSCANPYFEGGYIYVCNIDYHTYPGDYTWVEYNHWSQKITYVSRNWYRTWYHNAADPTYDYDYYYYDYNYSCTSCVTGGEPIVWGATVTLHLRVTDATNAQWVADPIFTLSDPSEGFYGTRGETCDTYNYDYYTYRSCYENWQHYSTRYGYASFPY